MQSITRIAARQTRVRDAKLRIFPNSAYPMVTAITGLIVGHGRHTSMEETTKARLMPFWEMFDELLNMILFMLVGLSLLARPNRGGTSLSAPQLFSARCWAVSYRSVRRSPSFQTVAPILQGTTQVIVWGGVRGGVSLALALSLTESPYKPYLVSPTWSVMFSLLVQASTLGWVMRKTGVQNQKIPEKAISPIY